MTVGVPDTNGIGWVTADSSDRPRNIEPRMVAMATRVLRALSDWGSQNTLTPLEMASVPVRADPPLAKAFMTMNSDAPASRPPLEWPIATAPDPPRGWAWRLPVAQRTTPMPIISAMLAMKRKVGTAKDRPASRMPRRLP